ncbi:Insulin-like growth factor 2 mRNA-binding protein 1 [Amphibalanus amphitrite]|uniref:Insulin-like growth factor 2 mRNA-binding protein 1 n=1 Tax=Amphibalanus amphitrite TaxID=1232801 RepID=A0A6A4VF64_AMPAM|nr:Insulin-like growth factor 2 mRNA-binding protein 1 [Amphibalanus amphitrite]
MPGPSCPTGNYSELPLRILVSSEMVGAIIGRQGNTIRQITQNTRARVDVHRKDNNGATEKAITIYGNPDNCDNACREILDVMTQEAANTNRGEVPLKILAHNNLIGRIIGKGGNVIKSIMEETDTRITVSRATDVNSFNLDRTITIRGTAEGIAEAERLVMTRLRQSYEHDLQTAAPQMGMYPDMGARMMPGYGRGEAGLYGAGPAGYGGLLAAAPGMHGMHGQPESVFVYVPAASVGAIIGRKGSHIRSMIRFSGATVKIGQQEEAPLSGGRQSAAPPAGEAAAAQGGDGDGASPPEDAAEQAQTTETGESEEQQAEPPAAAEADEPVRQEGDGQAAEGATSDELLELKQKVEGLQLRASAAQMDRPPERKVAIYGTPEAQWKAQYMIFDKLREEGYGTGLDDVRLSVEISVPSSQVGRIIGKKGQNVRELQRTTGTVIKLPQPAEHGEPNAETAVHIMGPFISVQSAQRRIRALVAQGAPVPRLQPVSQPPPPAAVSDETPLV